jgi:signal transduction histidine kinase/CheY-like chemotaxis protein
MSPGDSQVGRAPFGVWARLGRFISQRGSPERERQRRRIVLDRTVIGAGAEMIAVVLGDIAYTAVFHQGVFPSASVLAALSAAALALLILAVRLGVFKRFYSLPFFLVVGVVGNANITGILHLTSHGGLGPFFYGYLLVLFSVANFFPARTGWMVATAAMTPISFAVLRLVDGGSIGGEATIVNLALLILFAVVVSFANLVTTFLFLGEIENRMAAELATRELQDLDRAKSEFFANLSHDLRSPLTAVLGPLNVLVSDAKVGLSATNRAYLQLALRGAARLDSMIDDLLELSRIDAGLGMVRPVRTDLVALVKEQAQAFESYAEGLGLSIVFTSSTERLLLNVDGDKIARVAMNLLSNACKFSKHGGKIDVEVRPHPEGGIIRVTDYGVGISPADRERIFRRFERGSNARESSLGGSGLGLAVIREFVSLHNGRVEVDSAPGKGSTFTVVLPRGEPRAITTPTETPLVSSRPPPGLLLPLLTPLPRPIPLGRPRILVADSDGALIQSLKLEFAEAYEVVAAADGDQALEVLRNGETILVIADAHLERIDGIELCRKMRAENSTARTLFILLTASDALETVLEGFAAGADDVVRKPFDLLALWARIEALFRRARIARFPSGDAARHAASTKRR